jgi:hypothetical protein
MPEETVVQAEEAAEEVQVEAPAEETEQTTEEFVETPVETPPVPPKKKSAQERIDEITRARREAEREREYWKQVALAKEHGNTPPQQPPRQPSPFPPRPELSQFETTTAYEDALFEWRDNIKELQTRSTMIQQEQNTALQAFNDRARKLREEHEDFDEVIESPVFSPVMRAALLKSEAGPEVAYFLGLPENRDAAEKIRALPIEMQPYELGKLATKLELAKQTKKVPSAPPPIKPVGMTGGGTGVDPSKMSTAEWMEWDKQKRLEKLKSKFGGP